MSNVVIFGLVGFVVVAAAIVLLSFLVEAMRPVPPTPERLSWAPDIPIRYVSVNGVRLRYIKTGEGPALVLLHTLRTQLDLFEKVVPELGEEFHRVCGRLSRPRLFRHTAREIRRGLFR